MYELWLNVSLKKRGKIQIHIQETLNAIFVPL